MKNAEKYKTAKERAEAFSRFCGVHSCDSCEFREHEVSYTAPSVCLAFWLDIEAEEEKPLPCPYCGGICECRKEWLGRCRVVCRTSDCWYSSRIYGSADAAIAAHNRVARAAKEKETNDEQ